MLIWLFTIWYKGIERYSMPTDPDINKVTWQKYIFEKYYSQKFIYSTQQERIHKSLFKKKKLLGINLRKTSQRMSS